MATAGDDTLTPDDVVDIVEELLPAQNKSYVLGLKLGLPMYVVDEIHATREQPEQRLLRVLLEFVKRVEPRPTWRVIADALRSHSINLPHLVDRVEAAHFPDTTSTSYVVSKTTVHQQTTSVPSCAGGSQSSTTTSETTPTQQATEHTLDIDDIFEVQSELTDIAYSWKGLGKALRLRLPVLDKIEADRQDCESRLEQVLSQWLQQAYNTERFGPPSWKVLVSAVAHPFGGNNYALAQQIAHRHNVPPPPPLSP